MIGESVNGLTNKILGETALVYPGYWRMGEKIIGD